MYCHTTVKEVNQNLTLPSMDVKNDTISDKYINNYKEDYVYMHACNKLMQLQITIHMHMYIHVHVHACTSLH